ncbi:alpha/beta hydrolase [Neomicrococcus aestuarii]|uniref:Alpha/beta hydrolase n=1 Tax=Neomicrococcus aestuarii TaxID=556325 RepID=A0A1L2ZQM3_9MICC|nr:alpha/beta hydrolase [Neomicrococcus aestuarii]
MADVSDVANPTDGTTIRYDVAGSGPAVILLHGSALSRVIWRGLGYVKGLSDYRTIRIDLRGHGRSGKPHEQSAYVMERFVEDVLTVMDAESVESASIMGYSLGGRLAFALAEAAPLRVDSLISLGGSPRKQEGQYERVFFPGYLEALKNEDIEAFADGTGVDPATRAAFVANDPLALAALFEYTESHDVGVSNDALAHLTMPALLMAGTRDEPRFSEAREAATIMPNAEFVALEGRTHGQTLFPNQEILDAVLPFLERLGK